MKVLNATFLDALEKGKGVPIMKIGLYHFEGDGWTLYGEFDVLEAVLARTRYDLFIKENLLDGSYVDSVIDSKWAIEITKGLKIAGTNHVLVSNFYYISTISYSDHWGSTHIIADLLPTTSIRSIDGTMSARNVIDQAFLQFNNLSYITYDTNRDIWFDWVFFDTDKELNLIDGRALEDIIQQKYFAYLFPRWFKLIYAYGVASNEGNNEDGTYTPFAHARTTYFLSTDKPVNLTWNSETGYTEYIDAATNGIQSLGFISTADDPRALATFQKWSRVFSGNLIQYIQRPDLRLEQGDLLKVSTDGFTQTRCFEQIEVYKSTNAFTNAESAASWFQIVRQLPYHPQYSVETILIDDFRNPYVDPTPSNPYVAPAPTPRPPLLTRNPINSPMPLPNLNWVMSAAFNGILNPDASNVQQALSIIDQHNHDAAYAAIADGVTSGDAHSHNGDDAAQIMHGYLGGLTNDDHTQYIKHELATAASDFLAASGSGAFVKKTLAETKTLLNVDTHTVQVRLNTNTALTAGDNAARIRIPAKWNGLKLIAVAASRMQGYNSITIQVRKVGVGDMLSTPITMDSGEGDTLTAATPAVINTSNDDVATGDSIAIDVDSVWTNTLHCLVELTFG